MAGTDRGLLVAQLGIANPESKDWLSQSITSVGNYASHIGADHIVLKRSRRSNFFYAKLDVLELLVRSPYEAMLYFDGDFLVAEPAYLEVDDWSSLLREVDFVAALDRNQPDYESEDWERLKPYSYARKTALYFNAGFYGITKKAAAQVLEVLDTNGYPEDLTFGDQDLLNSVIVALGLKVHLLDKRYNFYVPEEPDVKKHGLKFLHFVGQYKWCMHRFKGLVP